MYETTCIYCGKKMIWSADFLYTEVFQPMDEKDRERTVTEMACPGCGATAQFVEPRE